MKSDQIIGAKIGDNELSEFIINCKNVWVKYHERFISVMATEDNMVITNEKGNHTIKV